MPKTAVSSRWADSAHQMGSFRPQMGGIRPIYREQSRENTIKQNIATFVAVWYLMLFAEDKKQADTTTWDRGAASYLERHLRKVGLLHTKPNLAKWAMEFQSLRKKETRTAIRKALKWYCKNLHNKYTPQAHSAAGFRGKFTRIQVASRHNKKETNFCQEALDIYEKAALVWPNEGCPKDEVLQLIHDTYTGYSEFCDGLIECKATADKRGVRLLTYLSQVLPPPTVFTREWLGGAHDHAWSCASWQGLNNGFTWHINHWKFTSIGEGLCGDYSGEPKRWAWVVDQLILVINSKGQDVPS